jgi:uncharacterized membrane protein
MEAIFNWVYKSHFAASWFMTGLIWLIQIVHYPLFNQIGKDQFIKFHTAHTQLITYIVMPVMLIELISYGLFFFDYQTFNKFDLSILGVSLVGIWLTTMFLSIPAHNQLALGFNQEAYESLVKTNWIRTIFWTLKSIYLLMKIKLG